MTAACWARLGAHAAIRTCARVAIQRLRCEVAVPPLKCVLRSRRRSFGAANAEKRCADVERCGESSSQRLLANRSRARKRRAICSQEEPKTREKAKRVKHASRRALMTETRRDEVPKRVRDAARAATERDERDARSRARRARLARVTTRRPRRSRRASRASRRRARARESFL